MKVRGVKKKADSRASKDMEIPSLEVLERELERIQDRDDCVRLLGNMVFFLLAAAAASVLVMLLWLPVLQINGTSMEDTLKSGDLVVAVNGSRYKAGDVIAFNYNSSILVKRVIALSGDWVDIDGDGNVYVNEKLLDEPYVSEKALGKCSIEFPCRVQAGRVFVLGDHRTVSIDSRSSAVGCVEKKDVMGEVLLRIWPLSKIGFIK